MFGIISRDSLAKLYIHDHVKKVVADPEGQDLPGKPKLCKGVPIFEVVHIENPTEANCAEQPTNQTRKSEAKPWVNKSVLEASLVVNLLLKSNGDPKHTKTVKHFQNGQKSKNVGAYSKWQTDAVLQSHNQF